MAADGDEYMTVEEIAKEMRSSERFVKDELRRKNLRGTKGSRWVVTRADFKTYMDSRANIRPVRPARRAS